MLKEKEPVTVVGGPPIKTDQYTGNCTKDGDCFDMPGDWLVDIEGEKTKCLPKCVDGKCECKANIAEWNGDKYIYQDDSPLTNPPSNFTIINNKLEIIKSAIIDKGISESYFNDYFNLRGIGTGPNWSSFGAIFRLEVGDYTAHLGASINSNNTVTMDYNNLHDIKNVISREEAYNIIINCLGEGKIFTLKDFLEYGVIFLDEDGNLLAKAGSRKYNIEVNLETGECEKEKAEGAVWELFIKEPKAAEPTQNIWIYVGVVIIVLIVIISVFIKLRK